MRIFSLLLAGGIGLLTVHGSVRIDGFRVWSNATVFENSIVETGRAGARITVGSGEVLMGPGTRLRLGAAEVSLEHGCVQVRGAALKGAQMSGDCAAAIRANERELPPLSQRP